ncbi:uncharacterized protein LOC109600734 isoform X2 [Aethina tumida]|uniref:uncharacterized protein LOC109600734 isoform X2 n=1 Tax=Aethina tumida TaxID=116153 RepID=UPI002148B55A|nr:uncharacterized protein LOC109600734 isoform X2 [Aethina tumida]
MVISDPPSFCKCSELRTSQYGRDPLNEYLKERTCKARCCPPGSKKCASRSLSDKATSSEATCPDLFCRERVKIIKKDATKDDEKNENLQVCCSCDELSEDEMEDLLVQCRCKDHCPAKRAILAGERKKIYKFRTALENWKPGKVKICCPLCNKIGRPAIKQTKKQTLIARNSFKASVLIGCWPICIVPFLMAQSNIFLFCQSCKAYLGQYDKTKGCVKPPAQLKEQIAKIIKRGTY